MTGGLAGRRVLVTRAVNQAAALATALEARGAVVVAVPLIETRPVADADSIREAVARSTDVVLTSANAARHLLTAVATFPDELRVWTVGPQTAAAVSQAGGKRQPLAGDYASNAIAERFVAAGTAGRRVLLAQARDADPGLERRLRQAGERVERLVLYETGTIVESAGRLMSALARGIEVTTFLSGSAARAAVELCGPRPFAPLVNACIGESTAEAARGCGIPVSVVAAVHTGEGLVEALEEYFSTRRDGPGPAPPGVPVSR